MDEKVRQKVEQAKDVRAECRQFAMLYYHMCDVLVQNLGKDEAKRTVQKILYDLSVDRTDKLRQKAKEAGLPCTLETFAKINDLPSSGWIGELGKEHCPYANCWITYYEASPWFREFAPFYCDIIDTTNIENFSKCLTHRITKNVLNGFETCERVYEQSDEVKNGHYTYKPQPNAKAKAGK